MEGSDSRRYTRVFSQKRRSEEDLPRTWWADIRHEEVAWWQAGWQATPAPAEPTEPKLIPNVTTAEQIDVVTLAQTYIH